MTLLRVPSRLGRSAGVLLLAALGGCALVNPNITDFQFSLPPKSFTVDSSQLGLSGMGTIPQVPCTSDTQCAGLAGGGKAQFTCQAHNGGMYCAATVTINLVNPLNLQQEDQSFVDAVKNDPIVMAQILDVKYTVDSNSLDFDTPPINLYAAPSSVMSPTDPQAALIGTIATIPTTYSSGTQSLTFSKSGQQALDPYIQNYSQTFNIIASAQKTFYGGDPVPSGMLAMTVNADAVVSISH